MRDMAQRLADRSVFVAGAGGFIGARICAALSREGARVIALSRSGRAERLSGIATLEIVRGDLLKPKTLAAALSEGVDVVNAAYDFLFDEGAQRQAFDNLLAAAAHARAKRFVQLSSIAVYDDWPNGALTEDSPSDGPGSPYKALKREFERKLAASGLAHVILQPTIVYGAGGWQWTERPIEELSAGRVILPDNPRGLCHAVHVEDVAEAAVCALTAPTGEGRYIISGAEPVEWGDLYAGYARIIGAAAPEFQPFDAPVSAAPSSPSPLAMKAKKIARRLVGEGGLAALRKTIGGLKKRGGEIVTRPDGAMLDLMRARGGCSIERARAELGYEPKIDLAEGLERIRAARGS